MASFVVSEDVLARIHRDQVAMLVLVGELETLAREHDPKTANLIDKLATTLRGQMGLLAAVLDAVDADDTSGPVELRPRQRNQTE